MYNDFQKLYDELWNFNIDELKILKEDFISQFNQIIEEKERVKYEEK